MGRKASRTIRIGAGGGLATAHLIARVDYRMLKDNVEYQPLSVEQYQATYRQQQVRYLQKKAATLGFQRVPA